MVPSPDRRGVDDTAKSLTRTQQDALRAIAFFRRQKKVGKGWLVGDKRLSERSSSGLSSWNWWRKVSCEANRCCN
jgi:hypothetical protein